MPKKLLVASWTTLVGLAWVSAGFLGGIKWEHDHHPSPDPVIVLAKGSGRNSIDRRTNQLVYQAPLSCTFAWRIGRTAGGEWWLEGRSRTSVYDPTPDLTEVCSYAFGVTAISDYQMPPDGEPLRLSDPEPRKETP